jgi:hypothetical protein
MLGETRSIILIIHFPRFSLRRKCAVSIAKQKCGPSTGEPGFVLMGKPEPRCHLAGWPRFERVMASWQVGCI